MDQSYVIDDSVQHAYVAGRDAATFLPFLLPHLRAGMEVLDVRSLMREAGFVRLQGFALAPEVYGDEAATRWFADFGTVRRACLGGLTGPSRG